MARDFSSENGKKIRHLVVNLFFFQAAKEKFISSSFCSLFLLWDIVLKLLMSLKGGYAGFFEALSYKMINNINMIANFSAPMI